MAGRSNRLCKVISITILLVFTFQQIGWVQEGRPVWSNSLNSFNIQPHGSFPDVKVPYDVGEVNERADYGGKDLIINIQDAHASLSGQHSIVNILNTLISQYDVDLIALEGGSGYIDTSILQTFPDKDIRKSTANFLMKEGKLSAGEFFAATSDRSDIAFYGVEDSELYEKNISSFKDVMEERTEYVGNAESLIVQLDAISEKVYSEELKSFQENSRSHRTSRKGFEEYWDSLKALAEKKGVSFKGHPNVRKLVEAMRIEKSIDFAEANAERKELINSLSNVLDRKTMEDLVYRSLLFKQGKISPADFHAYLDLVASTGGVDTSPYENLNKFIRYVSVYEDIEITLLYREMSDLEDTIREKLFRNDDERDLHAWIKLMELLVKLYSVELNNNEFGYIENNRGMCEASKIAAFLKDICRRYDVSAGKGYETGLIFEGMDEAVVFYLTAEKRNRALLENTLKKMKSEGKHVAALITGGYHTSGLRELLKDKKLSYMVVVPKFQEGEERPYIAILTNKKKPYQKLIESGRYQLAVMAYFEDMNEEKFIESAMYALASVASSGGDWKAEAGMWFSLYSHEYERLRVESEEKVDGSITPAEFAGILGTGQAGSEGQLRIEQWNDSVLVIRTKDTETSYFILDPGEGGVLKSPQALSPIRGQQILEEISAGGKTARQGSGESDPSFVSGMSEGDIRVLIQRLNDDKELYYALVNRLMGEEDVDVAKVVRALKARPDMLLPEVRSHEDLAMTLRELTHRVRTAVKDSRMVIEKMSSDESIARYVTDFLVSARVYDPEPEKIMEALYARLGVEVIKEWEEIRALSTAMSFFGVHLTGYLARYRQIFRDGYKYSYGTILSVIGRLMVLFSEQEGISKDEFLGRFNGTEDAHAQILEIGGGLLHPVRDYFHAAESAREFVDRPVGLRNLEVLNLDPLVEEDAQNGIFRGNALKMQNFKNEQFSSIFCTNVLNPDCYGTYHDVNKRFWEENFPEERAMDEGAYYQKIALEFYRVLNPGGQVFIITGSEFNEDLNRILLDAGFKLVFSESNRTGCNVFRKPKEEDLSLTERRIYTMKAIGNISEFIEGQLAWMEDAFEGISEDGPLNAKDIVSLNIIKNGINHIDKALRGGLPMPLAEDFRQTLQTGGNMAAFDLPNRMLPVLILIGDVLSEGEMDQKAYDDIRTSIGSLKRILLSLKTARAGRISFVKWEEDQRELVNFRDWEALPPINSMEWRAFLLLQGHTSVLEKVQTRDEILKCFDIYANDLIKFTKLHLEGRLREPEDSEEMSLYAYALSYLMQVDPERMRTIGEFARKRIRESEGGYSASSASIIKIKQLVAPRMPLREYAIKVAPWLEEGLFFTIPLVAGSLLFGLDSVWTFTAVLAARGLFFVLHEGARPNASPAEYIFPLLTAGFGSVLSLVPIFWSSATAAPLYFILVSSIVSFIGHLSGNILASRYNMTPASLDDDESSSSSEDEESSSSSSSSEDGVPLWKTEFFQAWQDVVSGNNVTHFDDIPQNLRERLNSDHEGKAFVQNLDKIRAATHYIFEHMSDEDRDVAFRFIDNLVDEMGIAGWTLDDFEDLHGVRALVRNLLIVACNEKAIPERVKGVTRGITEGISLLAYYMERSICVARLYETMGPRFKEISAVTEPSFRGAPQGENDREYHQRLAELAPYNDIFYRNIRQQMEGQYLEELPVEGSHMRAYGNDALPFVVKVPIDGAVNVEGQPVDFDRDILPGVILARKRLGGLAANTHAMHNLAVNVRGFEFTFPNVVIQSRVTPLREKFHELAEEGDDASFEEIKQIIRMWWELQVEMWKRGVVDADIKLGDNYGYDELSGRVVIFDYTNIYSDMSKFWNEDHYEKINDLFRLTNGHMLEHETGSHDIADQYSYIGNDVFREHGVSIAGWGEDVKVSVWPTEEEQLLEEVFVPLNDPFMVNSSELARMIPTLRHMLVDVTSSDEGTSGDVVEEILSKVRDDMLWFHADRELGMSSGSTRTPDGVMRRNMTPRQEEQLMKPMMLLPFDVDLSAVADIVPQQMIPVIYQVLSDGELFSSLKIEVGDIDRVAVEKIAPAMGRDIVRLNIHTGETNRRLSVVLYKRGYNLPGVIADPYERVATRIVQLYRTFSLQEYAEDLGKIGVSGKHVMSRIQDVFRGSIYSEELEHFDAGGDATVYTNGDKSIVVKDLVKEDRDIIKRGRLHDETEEGPINGYLLAREHLGHQVIRFFIVRDLDVRIKDKEGNLKKKRIERAIIQKRVQVFFKEHRHDVRIGRRRYIGILADAIENGEMDIARMLIDEFLISIRYMLTRGVFDWDVKSENYGYDPSVGHIGSLDSGKFQAGSMTDPYHGNVFLRNMQATRNDIKEWTTAMIGRRNAEELAGYFERRVREVFSVSDFDVDITKDIREIQEDDDFSEVIRWDLSSSRGGIPVCYTGTEKMRATMAKHIAVCLEESGVRVSDLERLFASRGFRETRNDHERSVILGQPYYSSYVDYENIRDSTYVGIKVREMTDAPTARQVIHSRKYWKRDLSDENIEEIQKAVVKVLLRFYFHTQETYNALAELFDLDRATRVTDRLSMELEFKKIDRDVLTDEQKKFLSNMLSITEYGNLRQDISIAFDKLKEERRYPFDATMDDLVIRKENKKFYAEITSYGGMVRKGREVEAVDHMHRYLRIPYETILEALLEEKGRTQSAIFCERLYYQVKDDTEQKDIVRRKLEELYASRGRGFLGATLARKGEVRKDTYSIMVGIPIAVLNGMEESVIKDLDAIRNIRIVALEGNNVEGMLQQLEWARKDASSIASVMIDGGVDTSTIHDVVSRMVGEVKGYMFTLAHPDITKLTPETIKEIEDLPEFLREISDKYINSMHSFQISKRSIYELRMEKSYQTFSMNLLASGEQVPLENGVLHSKKGHYFLHYADGNSLLEDSRNKAIVPPGLEIITRRGMMRVSREEDLHSDRFFVVAPDGVTSREEKKEFKKELIELWMLEGVVGEDDIILLDRRGKAYTASELFALHVAEAPGADRRNSGFRCISGELEYDEEAAVNELVQVNLHPEAKSNINQYQVFVNLVMTKGKRAGLHSNLLTPMGMGRLYMFLPKANPVDLENEIRHYYDRFMKEILVKA
ncbi:MAG: hypothetical protein P9L88_04545 [Candidatus Tantalella remota]|nr:hypothetical protein [Candidatus Tantalella remota]